MVKIPQKNTGRSRGKGQGREGDESGGRNPTGNFTKERGRKIPMTFSWDLPSGYD